MSRKAVKRDAAIWDQPTIVTEKITEHMNPIALDSAWAAEKSDRKNLDEVLRTYTAS